MYFPFKDKSNLSVCLTFEQVVGENNQSKEVLWGHFLFGQPFASTGQINELFIYLTTTHT
jgi:hypothetical protein